MRVYCIYYFFLFIGRSFSQRSTWVGHLVRHSGATPHICEVCGKAFATKGDLATHSWIHSMNKPFTCEECGMSFPRKSNYTRHLRKHTGEKPYGCEFCTKRFARSENCREHERLHTKEKPFLCELCSMSFSDSGNFSKHKRTHLNSKKKRGGSDKLKMENINSVDLVTDFTITNRLEEEEKEDARRIGGVKPPPIKIDTHPMLLESVVVTMKETKEKRSSTRKKIKKTSSRKLKKNACTETVVLEPDLGLVPIAEENHQSLTLNVLRQPIILTKPIPVTIDNVIAPLSEPDKVNQAGTTGFIKLTPDSYLPNLTSQETLQSKLLTDPCFNQSKVPTLSTYSLMNNSEALKLLNCQLPVLATQPATTNSLLTDLNFSSVNGLGVNSNQTFMMLDYFQRDSSFSFANDGSLIVQATNFDQETRASDPTNASVMYNTSLVPSEHLVDTDTNPTSALCGTDFTLGNTNVTSIFTSDNDYDDELSQPIDTNKFLNEQYLVKKTDPEIPKETIESPVVESSGGGLENDMSVCPS